MKFITKYCQFPLFFHRKKLNTQSKSNFLFSQTFCHRNQFNKKASNTEHPKFSVIKKIHSNPSNFSHRHSSRENNPAGYGTSSSTSPKSRHAILDKKLARSLPSSTRSHPLLARARAGLYGFSASFPHPPTHLVITLSSPLGSN